MLANYLIGLREGLEAALVVGILVAYLVRSGRRELVPQVWAGVVSAAGVSLVVGAVLTFSGRDLATGTEEAIAGALSVAAVALVTWMVFWMARTSRLLRHHLESSLDRAVDLGGLAVFALAVLSVGREGLETALFLWARNTMGAGPAPLLGAVLGLSTAVALGWAIYLGAVRLNLRVFFLWTGAFLVLVAAGVLANGVHDLQGAGILPAGDVLAFNVSAAVPPSSWYGTLLGGVLGFSPDPSVLEVVTWVAYAVPVLYLFLLVSRPRVDPGRLATRKVGDSLMA